MTPEEAYQKVLELLAEDDVFDHLRFTGTIDSDLTYDPRIPQVFLDAFPNKEEVGT